MVLKKNDQLRDGGNYRFLTRTRQKVLGKTADHVM